MEDQVWRQEVGYCLMLYRRVLEQGVQRLEDGMISNHTLYGTIRRDDKQSYLIWINDDQSVIIPYMELWTLVKHALIKSNVSCCWGKAAHST